MAKTLLILSGDCDAAEIAGRAKSLGHSLVVSDADPEAPAFALADSCLIADVRGAPETAAAAERYNRKIRRIDGVLCAADAALTAAGVTQRLRLPGLPYHVAELLEDRLAMKRAFRSAGVPTPWHAEIFTAQDLQRAVIARGPGLVVKPVEQRGAQGAQRLNKAQDLACAFEAARAASPSERVMVEEAPETVKATVFMRDRSCHVERSGLGDLIERAASALDVRDGPLVAEIAEMNGTAFLVELSPRLSPDCEFLESVIAWATGESAAP